MPATRPVKVSHIKVLQRQGHEIRKGSLSIDGTIAFAATYNELVIERWTIL